MYSNLIFIHVHSFVQWAINHFLLRLCKDYNCAKHQSWLPHGIYFYLRTNMWTSVTLHVHWYKVVYWWISFTTRHITLMLGLVWCLHVLVFPYSQQTMLWASNERIKLFITHYTHTCGITQLISRLINFPRVINCNNYKTWNCGNGFKNKEFNIDTDLCRKETNSVNKNINSVNKNINCINNKTTTHTFTHKYTYFWLSITANSILKNVTYVHGPINHGLATPLFKL